MSKILLFALVAVAVYLFIRFQKRPPPAPRAPAASAEPMIACSRCGVHVPRSEAIGGAGAYFCSEEHRVLGPG
jgi:uncharacterized protein